MPSRPTLVLGVAIVSVGIGIAIVHNMQTEERRRLHQGVIRDKAVLAEKERARAQGKGG